MTTYNTWNGGKSYTAEELLEACDAADTQEVDLTEVLDNDLATVPALIRSLIGRIKELEEANQ
jgi:hypothetical protein